eukprot:s2280_g1.t2
MFAILNIMGFFENQVHYLSAFKQANPSNLEARWIPNCSFGSVSVYVVTYEHWSLNFVTKEIVRCASLCRLFFQTSNVSRVVCPLVRQAMSQADADPGTPEVGYLDGNSPQVINNDSIYLILGLAVAIVMGCLLDKLSTFKHFNAKNREPFWVLLLVLVSYGYLIPGLVEVLFSFNLVFDTGAGGFFGIGPDAGFNHAPPTTETMLGLVRLLWETGSWLGALLVVFYAIAIPVTKLLLLLVGNLIQKDLPKASRRCIQSVQNISKWACPDMFAYILLMHLVKSLSHPPYLKANGRLDLGFTCFSLFCLGSTVAALGIRVPDREHGCFQQIGRALNEQSLLWAVTALFVLFAIPFFWGLNETVMGLKVGELDPMIEMTLSFVGLTREKLKSDVSIMNCLGSLASEISHGEVNSFIGFVMFSVFVIGMTLLDMLVLLWIAIRSWRGRPVAPTAVCPPRNVVSLHFPPPCGSVFFAMPRSVQMMMLLALSSFLSGSATRLANGLTFAKLKEVMDLLGAMREKVLDEGRQQAELFDKFQCYCKTNVASLADKIETVNRQIEPMKSEISEIDGQSSSLQAEVEQHVRDEKSVLEGTQEARQIRQRASDETKGRAKELSEHLRLMDDAISRIQTGAGTKFLQKEVQQILARRETLTDQSFGGVVSFSSDPEVALGTLRKLRSDIARDYEEILQSEQSSAAEFRDLEMSKEKEGRSLQQQIRQKGSRLSDLKIRLVQLKKDLEQSGQQVDEDQQALDDLEEVCRHKGDDWQNAEARRGDELAAIAEAQTLLSPDGFGADTPRTLGLLDRLDLNRRDDFGLGSLSLLQVQHSGPRLGTEFVWLAMRGNDKGLKKVITGIEKHVANLAKEEMSEKQKKLNCQAQYSRLAQQAAELSSKREDGESALRRLGCNETGGGLIGILFEYLQEIFAKSKSWPNWKSRRGALEASKQEAESLRRQETAEFQKLKADASEAKDSSDLLQKAILRLRATYVADKGQSLLEARKFLLQALPGNPPKMDFTSSGGQTMSEKVILLLRKLVKDLDDEVAEAEKAETTGQLDHQNFLQEVQCMQKSLLISKRQAKASLETELATLKKRSASQHREEQDQKDTLELKASLDSECAWLLGNWDDRVAARERDVQALANAKATIQRWMQLSWVLKKLSMVDVTCMGVLIVTMCMAMYRQYVQVDMGVGQWLLVSSEVVHYFTYYIVKGYTEDKDKLDLGNTMHGDEEEEETSDLSSSTVMDEDIILPI